MSTTALCEIQAPRPTLGHIERIVRFCVDEIALPVDVVGREITRGSHGAGAAESEYRSYQDGVIPAEQSLPLFAGKERWQAWQRK